jgi:hypothetical protein
MSESLIQIKESELRSLVRVMVQQTLAEMLGLNAQVAIEPKAAEWLETREAARSLNTTASALNARRRNGWFQRGIHYRICNQNPSATGSGARYEYHVDRCQQRLSEPPSKWNRPKPTY